MNEQDRYGELLRRSKTDSNIKARIQERINSDPVFARGFQSYIQSQKAPVAQAPVAPAIEEPAEESNISIFEQKNNEFQGKLDNATNFITNQVTGQEGPEFKADTIGGDFAGEVLKSTLGERGITGFANSIASPSRSKTDINSLTESINMNVEQQLKLIERIKQSRDPNEITRLGNLTNTLRQEADGLNQQIEGVQEELPTNKEVLGQAGNIATLGTVPTVKKGFQAATKAPSFLRGLKTATKATAPTAALSAGSDTLADGGTIKDAAINSAISAAASPLIAFGGTLYSRYGTSKGRRIVQELKTDKSVRNATEIKVTGSAKDFPKRERLATEGGNSLFSSKDVLATDEGQERAIRLIRDEIDTIANTPASTRAVQSVGADGKVKLNNAATKNTDIESIPDIAKTTQGLITKLEVELSAAAKQIEFNDLQKSRMKLRFNETLNGVGQTPGVNLSWAGNSKKDKQVRQIIKSYQDAVDKATNVDDLLSARKTFDNDLENRVAGYSKAGEDAPQLIKDLRKLRDEASDAILDSVPDNQVGLFIDSLNDQHVLINAKGDIVNNARPGSKWSKFLKGNLGQQVRTLGSAFVGIGVGGLGTAIGLGGFRGN